MNVRCRNATIVGVLLLPCSLVFGAWTQLNPEILGGVYNGVHFPTGQTTVGYACGSGLDTATHQIMGLIVKTTDGGTTWAQQVSNTQSILRSIYFTDANTGYACGIGGTVCQTTDGGNAWTVQTVSGGEQLNYVQFPSNGVTGYIGCVSAVAHGGEVYKTTNGNDWAPITIGGPLTTSYSCAFATDSIGIIFGPDAFVYGNDGYQDPQAPGCDMIAASYSKSDSNRAYLVGNDTALGTGIVRYTATGGYPKWDSVFLPLHPVVATLSCVDYASPETAYVGGADGFIGATGRTHPYYIWQTSTNYSGPIFGICFPNGADTGYAAAGPIILKTTDGGFPWYGHWVAEDKAPVVARTGIRVVSNPCRGGIALRSDADVAVTVFDAAGRMVVRRAASKGLNFLPLRTGAYFVRAGAHTTRAVVTD